MATGYELGKERKEERSLPLQLTHPCLGWHLVFVGRGTEHQKLWEERAADLGHRAAPEPNCPSHYASLCTLYHRRCGAHALSGTHTLGCFSSWNQSWGCLERGRIHFLPWAAEQAEGQGWTGGSPRWHREWKHSI